MNENKGSRLAISLGNQLVDVDLLGWEKIPENDETSEDLCWTWSDSTVVSWAYESSENETSDLGLGATVSAQLQSTRLAQLVQLFWQSAVVTQTANYLVR